MNKNAIYIVSPGRSILTAKRGMAHAGGKITLADLRVEKPAEVMASFVASGRVEVDRASFDAKVAAAKKEKARIVAAVKDGKERKAASDKVAEEGGDTPATEAEIIEAIGKLAEDNTEHWTTSGKPQVAAIETLIGKQISAADRDAAWLAMQATS